MLELLTNLFKTAIISPPKNLRRGFMKLIKLLGLLYLIFHLSPSYAQNGAVRPLSLAEAVDIARKQSYQIQIAESQVAQAKGQSLESWSGFLPHFSISENYVKSNDPVMVFSFKLKQGIFNQNDFNLSTLNNPDAIENFTTSFQVQQPILNFDAIFGKSAASLGVKAREQMLARSQEAISLHVKKAYYGLILANENLKAISEAVAAAQRHRDDAKAALDEGIINEADYLGAEVRLAELQEQRITAEHQIANASDGLKFVMGFEEDFLIVPTDSIAAPAEIPTENNFDEQIAWRSDLRAVHFQTQAARRNLWMQRSGWLPRLNAFGGIEWNASEVFRKDASSWAVGFQMQWQVFDGLGNFGRSQKAKAEAEAVAVQSREAEEKAKMEVRQAQRAVQSAQQRLSVAESAVKQASASLRIVEERFREGLEKTSDLLDKEVMLTNARLRYLKARHDYAIAASELQFALGN
jgi:outer membrane protein TolC